MIRLLVALLVLAGCASGAGERHASPLQALRWTGMATIHDGARTIDIGVRTRVVPFRSARSESWLLSQGPASTRTMIIEPEGGWIERSGKREPMPEAMLRHERQQFAIYGLMQLALLAGPDGDARRTVAVRNGPPTQFTYASDGRLLTASNRVDNPEGTGTIDQLFRFSGELRGSGLSWPQRIDILHAGKPYFTLELNSFNAEPERIGDTGD